MKLFRMLFVVDFLIATIIGLCFCVGLADAVSDRQVDREDLLLWPPLIAGIGSVLAGAWWLKSRQRWHAANGVLMIMAVPGLIAALILLYLSGELMRPSAWH